MIQTRPLVGAALFAAAMQIVPATDSIAKILTADFEPTQIAWSRTFFQALFLASALALVNFRARGERVSAIVWQPWNWGAFLRPHWIRGFCWAGATVSFFVALRENPLPNALAALFVAPLAATALAPLFLGERVRPFYALCALGGFCGVVVVLRPAAADFRPSILFAVAAGLFYAGYLLATRFSAARFVPLENALGAALTGLLLLLPLALWRWDWPSGGEWALMILMGAMSAFGHWLIAFACRFAPMSFLAPFNYTEIVGASICSWIIFRELPDAVGWLGIAIIVSFGVTLSLAEWRANRKQQSAK